MRNGLSGLGMLGAALLAGLIAIVANTLVLEAADLIQRLGLLNKVMEWIAGGLQPSPSALNSAVKGRQPGPLLVPPQIHNWPVSRSMRQETPADVAGEIS